jgi:hypothetical protein
MEPDKVATPPRWRLVPGLKRRRPTSWHGGNTGSLMLSLSWRPRHRLLPTDTQPRQSPASEGAMDGIRYHAQGVRSTGRSVECRGERGARQPAMVWARRPWSLGFIPWAEAEPDDLATNRSGARGIHVEITAVASDLGKEFLTSQPHKSVSHPANSKEAAHRRWAGARALGVDWAEF